MSTLVELLAKHLDTWPEYDGKPASTIVQGQNRCWINSPNPSRPPRWYGPKDEDGEWGSDYYDSTQLPEQASDYMEAIVTKEMWEKAKFWTDAPPDATHRGDEVVGKYRAGFYRLNTDGVWEVWASLSKKWLVSNRCRQESDHSFLIPRPSTPAQGKAPENDVDSW